jgi:hypothetical protein
MFWIVHPQRAHDGYATFMTRVKDSVQIGQYRVAASNRLTNPAYEKEYMMMMMMMMSPIQKNTGGVFHRTRL